MSAIKRKNSFYREKGMIRKLGLVLVVASFLVGTALAGTGMAGVSINIGLGLGAPAVYPAPPPAVFPGPPDMVVIPGTYVYYAPGMQFDVFFYSGWWWRPWRGHWYRSYGYRGPWRYAAPGIVPRPLVMLPPRWRSDLRYGPPAIPYGRLHRNWRRWQRERYWQNQDRWHRGGHRGGDGGDRGDGGHGWGRGMGHGMGRGGDQ